MGEPVAGLTDSAGQSVVVVVAMITHLVSSGDAHTEVHLIGGTYVRVRGAIEEIASRFWPTRPEA